MPEKKGLLIVVVIASVVVFVGVVWAMATYLPVVLGGEVSPTATADEIIANANCVHTVAYWEAHTEAYPPQMVIAGQVYTTGDIASIFADTKNGPWEELRAQLAAAYLNIRGGADESTIEQVLFDAYGWLVDHASGSELAEGEREEAVRLYELLKAYNQGSGGVAACEPLTPGEAATSGILTKISTATLPVAQTTTTPARSGTSTRPRETAQVTSTSTFAPIYTQIVPSSTPAQPTNTQAHATLTPSRTIALSATFTPIRTTQAPSPTNTHSPTPSKTPNPTNTPKPSDTPVPTDTPTLPASPTAEFTLPPP